MIVGPSQLNHLIEMHGLVGPYEGDRVTHDSIDLRIGALFKHNGGARLMADKEQMSVGEMTEMIPEIGIWTLAEPGFYLARTIEEVNVPPNMAAVAMGRSTLFRAGIITSTGYVDPGYQGKIHFGFRTYEAPTKIEYGFRMIQLVFATAELVAPYNGNYQGGKIRPTN